MLGNYYLLSEWTLDKAKWIGFQFGRPELGKGMLQAFRRQDNPSPTTLVKLRGLSPESRYKLKDLSSKWTGEYTGREPMEEGLPISVANAPGDALIV